MSCSLSCVAVAELDADYAEGRMLWIERLRYRLHLWTCRRCRARGELRLP